jgi:hypothetical protein
MSFREWLDERGRAGFHNAAEDISYREKRIKRVRPFL